MVVPDVGYYRCVSYICGYAIWTFVGISTHLHSVPHTFDCCWIGCGYLVTVVDALYVTTFTLHRHFRRFDI